MPTDAYTENAREWLDARFTRTEPDGIYRAHQPIYGFRAGHCEPGLAGRYVRTLEIMRALSRLSFESCLDVGAAEGYKAALVRRLFGARVVACDLSESACLRAREIYGLDAEAADARELPFADESFDAVLSSETLEHVPDFEGAVRELARVAARALVITVPHESSASIARARDSARPHGHLHSLDRHSLDFLAREHGWTVLSRPLASPVTRALGGLVEGSKREPRSAHRDWNAVVATYNAAAAIVSRLLGAGSEAALVELDRRMCRRFSAHGALLFVVLKGPGVRLIPSRRAVHADEIIDFVVPFHRPPTIAA